MEEGKNDKFSWSLKTALKQGYLIKFHRGLLKEPKMKYFVLTPHRLAWFNYKPEEDTNPMGVLPLKHLTSIKVHQIELNSCMLSCMAIISRTASNFLLAFSRKEDRDEWMMAVMTAFAEVLVSRIKSPTRLEVSKPKVHVGGEGVVAAEVTQLHGIVTNLSHGQGGQQRRKRNRERTLRRSKSYDALTRNDCRNNLTHEIPEVEDASVAYEPRRKRKSEPDIHNDITELSSCWTTSNGQETSQDKCMRMFRSNCFDHRDSLELVSSRQCSKCDVKSIITKIISKFEHSTKLVHLKS